PVSQNSLPSKPSNSTPLGTSDDLDIIAGFSTHFLSVSLLISTVRRQMRRLLRRVRAGIRTGLRAGGRGVAGNRDFPVLNRIFPVSGQVFPVSVRLHSGFGSSHS